MGGGGAESKLIPTKLNSSGVSLWLWLEAFESLKT